MQLYLREHRKTGMKYLGYSNDAVQREKTYTLDSTVWGKHLQEFGVDFSTKILLETDDQELLTKTAIAYSIANQIWDNPKFANQQLENARPGHVKAEFWSKEMIRTHQENAKDPVIRKKMSVAMRGKTKSEEHRRKLSIAKTGIFPSEETRRKRSISMLGKNAGEKSSSFGKVSARDLRTGKTLKVSKEEFHRRDYYVGVTSKKPNYKKENNDKSRKCSTH